jgi:predicted protein tyrosine phosphatase
MDREKIKLLFVCTVNRMRSATAQKIYETDDRFEVKSAGTDKTANTVLTNELLEWADTIVVMEKTHRNVIQRGSRTFTKQKESHVYTFQTTMTSCNQN